MSGTYPEPRAPTALRATDTGYWLRHGVAGGIAAGVLFAAFEMIVAALLSGVEAIFMPLRMIGAMVLGPGALERSYDLLLAALTGVVVHLLLAALFGVAFTLVVSGLPRVARSWSGIVTTGAVYGTLLWLVNFYLVAPAAGWIWFPQRADQLWQGFVAHAFFYGTVLGVYIASAKPPLRPSDLV